MPTNEMSSSFIKNEYFIDLGQIYRPRQAFRGVLGTLRFAVRTRLITNREIKELPFAYSNLK